MALIDQKGKFMGFINIIDLSIFIIIIAFGTGFLWVYSGKSSLNEIIKAKGIAEVTVEIKGLRVKDLSIFKKGEKVFITIRNQPYTDVEISEIKTKRRLLTFLSPDGKEVITKLDPTDPYVTNIELIIKDQAVLTDKGIVMGGNKIKVGIPLELEGFGYRMKGSIIDVKMQEIK